MGTSPRVYLEMLFRRPARHARNTSSHNPNSAWRYGDAYRAGRLCGVQGETFDLAANNQLATQIAYRPLGIPNPYSTDDAGVAWPANSWVLICSQPQPFTPLFSAWTVISSSSTITTGLSPITGIWVGPIEFQFQNIPAGCTITVKLKRASDGLVLETVTLVAANGSFQAATLDASANTCTTEISFSGGHPSHYRTVDWGKWFAGLPVVTGDVPSGYVARADTDLGHSVDAAAASLGTDLSIVNQVKSLRPPGAVPFPNTDSMICEPGFGYPVGVCYALRELVTAGASNLLSEVPDACLMPLWIDAATFKRYSLPPHTRGPTRDIISNSGTLGGTPGVFTGTLAPSSTGVPIYGDVRNARLTYSVTKGFTIDSFSVTVKLFRYPNWLDTIGAKTVLATQTFTADGSGVIDLAGFLMDDLRHRGSLFLEADYSMTLISGMGYLSGTIDVAFTFRLSREVMPVPFSWVDSTGGVHSGAYRASRLRDPQTTPGDAQLLKATAGALSYAVPDLRVMAPGGGGVSSWMNNQVIVEFRPTSGPALYTCGSAGYTYGEYEFIINRLSQQRLCLSHGDGRRFWGAVPSSSNTPVTLTLTPVTPTSTVIPGAGITTAAGHRTPLGFFGFVDSQYLFYSFVATDAGTYEVTLTGGTANDIGMAAELAVSTVEQLCAASTPVMIEHDNGNAFYDGSVTVGNSPPAFPSASLSYPVGPAPTGLWTGQAGRVATWGGTAGVGTFPGWSFIVPTENSRWGKWFWDGSQFLDATTMAVKATIVAAAGQTVYVRVAGQAAERTANMAPLGARLSWTKVA